MVVALKFNYQDGYSIEKVQAIALADTYTEITKIREERLHKIERRISRGIISISDALISAQSEGGNFVDLVYKRDLGVNGYKEFKRDIETQLESQDTEILFQQEIFVNQSNGQLSKKLFQIRRKEYDGTWNEWQDINGDFVYTISSRGFSPHSPSGVAPNINITSTELKNFFKENYQIRNIEQ